MKASALEDPISFLETEP